jgi:hypothetical protein
MDKLPAVYVDADRTIPVDVSDPSIAPLISSYLKAQEEQMVAVALALKLARIAQSAVERAMEFSKTNSIEDESDPRVIGIMAELKAVREQSTAACGIATTKMQACVDLLKQIECTSRNRCITFN